MNIYQPKKNILPKILSIFPVFIGLFVFLGQGLINDSYLLIVIGILVISAGVWTWFGKAYTYIDPINKKVINKKEWLWFSWTSDISLSQYKYVSVVLAPRANSPSVVTPVSYDVNLVARNETSDHSGGFTINVWMGRFYPKSGGHTKALSVAEDISQQTGIPVSCKLNF